VGEMYTAAELPDIRNRLVGDLARPLTSNAAYEVYALHARAGMQVPADPGVRDPYLQARLLVRHELTRLRNASLYWVSPEMTKLCLAAAPGMPVFRPCQEDLPSAYGLIYFAAPLGGYTPWLHNTVFEFSDGHTVEHRPPEHGYQVCAATWGPWDEGGRWKRGGTWFTFYTASGGPDEMAQIHGVDLEEAQRLAAALPPLRLDNESKLPVSPADDGPGVGPLEDAVRNPGSTAYWMQLVLCAFQLMHTARAVLADTTYPARAAQRRSQRAGVVQPASPVRLVDITAGGVHRRQPDDAEGGEGGRTYHVRWLVNGHWRNQWYPSREEHRPVWIDPHIKGPKEAPLQIRERVNVWQSPRESPPQSARERS
jgi:hypothetical protein